MGVTVHTVGARQQQPSAKLDKHFLDFPEESQNYNCLAFYSRPELS